MRLHQGCLALLLQERFELQHSRLDRVQLPIPIIDDRGHAAAIIMLTLVRSMQCLLSAGIRQCSFEECMTSTGAQGLGGSCMILFAPRKILTRHWFPTRVSGYLRLSATREGRVTLEPI